MVRDDAGVLWVRCNQGHSIDVPDLALATITAQDLQPSVAAGSADLYTPAYPVHGTTVEAWNDIRCSGLCRMGRAHVHFAVGLPGDSGVISGMRKSCRVHIYVDALAILGAGIPLYRSANGVILCPGAGSRGMIDRKFFHQVTIDGQNIDLAAEFAKKADMLNAPPKRPTDQSIEFRRAPGPIVDIGANMTSRQFRKDAAAALARAFDANVTRVVITGTSLEDSKKAQRMCTELTTQAGNEIGGGDVKVSLPELFHTAGVHPHNAKQFSAEGNGGTIAQLQQTFAESDRCVAVGETGLDYNRMKSPKEAQIDSFAAHVAYAQASGRNLFLHERDAFEDFVAVLDAEFGRSLVPPVDVCVHCFTGNESELKEYIDRGFFIGFTGCVCDDKRGIHLRQLLPLVPRDRLMIETDAPYMLPSGRKGRCEPAHLVSVLATVAELWSCSEEEAAATTTANAVRFFKLPC